MRHRASASRSTVGERLTLSPTTSDQASDVPSPWPTSPKRPSAAIQPAFPASPRDEGRASFRPGRLPSVGSPKGKGRSTALPPSPKPHATRPGDAVVAARLAAHEAYCPVELQAGCRLPTSAARHDPRAHPASSGPSTRVACRAGSLRRESPVEVSVRGSRSLPTAPEPNPRHPSSSRSVFVVGKHALRRPTPRPRPAFHRPPRRGRRTRRPSAFHQLLKPPKRWAETPCRVPQPGDGEAPFRPERGEPLW